MKTATGNCLQVKLRIRQVEWLDSAPLAILQIAQESKQL